MLTLPMAGLLKQRFPKSYLTFLGRAYTTPVLEQCSHVDNILTLEELTVNGERGAVETLRQMHIDAFVHVFPVRNIARWAARAEIPHRIGTNRRWWHWPNCNHRIPLSRRNSDLHESQLNVKLLAPFGITSEPTTTELAARTGFFPPPPEPGLLEHLMPGKKHVILHPYSSGSAVEWGLERYTELIHLMDPLEFQFIITGTALEAEKYRMKLPVKLPNVTDLGGQLDLRGLISLIGACDAIVAASTGPLHIGAACGIRAIGLYANIRPMHPGRWAPIGKDAHALIEEDLIPTTDPQQHISAIRPTQVMRLLEDLL